MDPAAHRAAAQTALSAGDVQGAIGHLERAAAKGQAGPTDWLGIAALYRSSGRPRRALDAVHRALAQSPLDFTALVLKASLLDQMGEDSGPAWDHALAQRPAGEMPPQLATAVAQGEQRHGLWLADREHRMRKAMAAAEAQADDDARRRIGRFRANVLRKTRPFHSNPTHFHYPELAEREFHPRSAFSWLAELEAATQAIRAEFEAVVRADRAELAPYIQYGDHEPLDQWRPLNHNPDWTAIHLIRNGEIVECNARHCPTTLGILASLPQPNIPGAGPNAMFSLLAPGTSIPPHVGVNNARLVCHLPLVVPEGCWFRVGAEIRNWRIGEAFVFDDTIEHEASNPSGQLRVVFIFDVWHPDLSEVERAAVAALIESEGGAGPAAL